MFAISNVGRRLLRKLQKKAYRHAYVAEHVRRGVATQIRALREQRAWNQGKLSIELGKPQSVVSRLEDPSYGKVTIQTLLEIANVFDVALQVRFVSHSSFLQQTRDLTSSSMQVPSFNGDLGMTAALPINWIQIQNISTGSLGPSIASSMSMAGSQIHVAFASTPGVESSVH